ncbi:MAG TPA: hypothetical protein VFV92_14375 [Candidatus Bathyarchaeia archaeon]|nr:hypothetical protein [Candidatus Bathyarchaeia archaeon]
MVSLGRQFLLYRVVEALDRTSGRVYTDDPHFDKIPGIHALWGRA